MSDFIKYFEPLSEKIKDFVFFAWFIREDINLENIVGINCSSSSVARKTDCMRRVKEYIEELKLPLVVNEELKLTSYFTIKLNK